jgi:hypothetical protein
VENGWALGKFAGGFAQARRLTLGSSNLVYFCEPTLRTQLHMSVCGRLCLKNSLVERARAR